MAAGICIKIITFVASSCESRLGIERAQGVFNERQLSYAMMACSHVGSLGGFFLRHSLSACFNLLELT